MSEKKSNSPKVDVIALIKPYFWFVLILFLLSIVINGLNLFLPKLISDVIDTYTSQKSLDNNLLNIAYVIIIFSFIFTVIQSIIGSYVSEKMAFDLRSKIISKLAHQNYNYVDTIGSSKLLTNITSDVDKVKIIISQVVVTAFSAILIFFGAAGFLVYINTKLGLIALSVIPIIILLFASIFGRIGKFFQQSQQNLEKLNQVINETVLGAILIRVLNSQSTEISKFEKVSEDGKAISLKIINMFSTLIPAITFLANLAVLGIIWFGGKEVIEGRLSVGDFGAFFTYLSMLIFPIFMLGFIGSSLSSSLVSLGRIQEILDSPISTNTGTIQKKIDGKIEFKNVTLELDNKTILKNISFCIPAKTRTAILGPTAAGKTQIFNFISNLIKPTTGEILIDDILLSEFESDSFYKQVGLVFQESIIFNTTIRENIQFRNDTNEDDEATGLNKAIETAALKELIQTLPKGLETVIDERGSNLSGGQKQRLTLARTLAINPKLLLLDDFTARVDINTENQILTKLATNYPDLTLISITQKIEPIKNYDQIIVIMEGELIAIGKHKELLETSLEYRQIWESQQSLEA